MHGARDPDRTASARIEHACRWLDRSVCRSVAAMLRERRGLARSQRFDALAMSSRCCVDANRCVHASLLDGVCDGVARSARRARARLARTAARACAADCVKHAGRVSRSVARARSGTCPRQSTAAARVSVHHPQSLCPCGFSENAMTRAAALRRCQARVAMLVVRVCGGV